MVSRKSLSIFVLVIFFLIAAPLTAAASFDNVKDSKDIDKGNSFSIGNKDIVYNPIWKTYKPIEVKNMFGLGKTLLQGAITQHDNVCGSSCSSTMEIYLGEDSVLIDGIDFYTIDSSGVRIKEGIKSYQLYVNDIPYIIGTEMTEGTYQVRLDGEKNFYKTVDWVIRTQGETLTSWAVWGENFNVNLSLYYKMDNTSVSDELGWNDGVDQGTSVVPGIINNSLYFDEAQTDWIQVNNLTGWIAEEEGTLAFWMKPDTYNTVTRYIMHHTDVPTTSDRFGFYLDSDAGFSGLGFIFMDNPGGLANDSRSTWANGSWFHVVGTWNSSGDTELWVNGLLIDTHSGATIVNFANDEFDIGRAISGATYYDGALDEIAAWKRKLNSTEIVDLYNNGTGITHIANIPPVVTLNFPIVDAAINQSSVTFNCTVSDNVGVVNVSLYIDGLLNETNSSGVNNSDYLFPRTFSEGSYNWTCDGVDTVNLVTTAAYRNFTVDFTIPVINVTSPSAIVNYGALGQSIDLNWTITESNPNTCWYNYNNTNTTVTCADQNVSFILTSQKNLTFYANDTASSQVNFTRFWDYKLFGNSETYNLTTYETFTEGFRINITANGSQAVSANLVYDGTSYIGTKVGNNFEMEFNRDIDVSTVAIAAAQNKSFYWNITYDLEVIQSTTNNQSVGRIALGLCNATLAVPYINLTFKDEETTIATNATIDTSTWTYYLGDGTTNKTLLYSTTGANESYGFCFIPSDKTVTSAVELQYSDTGYPQRRWTTSGSLTNTTSDKTLYMLASADGTYSVYQVQNTVGTGIAGVEVTAERQFAGVWTLVEEGETDSGGAVTFWLNPDYNHRITFTKETYTTIQVTVRPSSSTYTVVMGTTQDGASYNSSMEGLSWVVYPDLGKVLFPNTTQIFLFNITANLSNIDSCKMEVISNDSVSLGTTTGCDSKGGNLSLSVALGMNRSVRAIYSVDIGDGYVILDADAYWIVMVTNIPERGTLVAFFKYARELNEFGNDNNRQEFSRVVLFFLMMAIVMAFISKTTNWDLITLGGSLVFMNFIIIFGSYAGFLTLSYTGVNGWMDKHVVALITSLFTAGFIFNKMERGS